MKKSYIMFGFGVLIFGVTALAVGCGSSASTNATTTTAAATTTTTTAAATTTTTTTSTTTTTAGTTTSTTTTTTTTTAAFTLTSSAFDNNDPIPNEYSHDVYDGTTGNNTSIPLSWSNPPAGTRSFAISMRDSSTTPEYVHWLVINITSSATSIAKDASGTGSMPNGSVELKSDDGSSGYEGPWPPVADSAHSYVITVYALNTNDISGSVNPSAQYTFEQFENAIQADVIDDTTLTGTFDR